MNTGIDISADYILVLATAVGLALKVNLANLSSAENYLGPNPKYVFGDTNTWIAVLILDGCAYFHYI